MKSLTKRQTPTAPCVVTTTIKLVGLDRAVRDCSYFEKYYGRDEVELGTMFSFISGDIRRVIQWCRDDLLKEIKSFESIDLNLQDFFIGDVTVKMLIMRACSQPIKCFSESGEHIADLKITVEDYPE